ncbi:conjugal transfer protein TraG N-terminal domain-containing protein [Celeribacter naphthalenivorans]|uniref:conjugal transfer protein TraG N-terminal domain-containing protein n=1 Tax=Celeribacter naphthalenivorans TaxID=1614694 RepID=UPI001CFBA5E8|nr:conjugal transfer protein TraG N-terminal domain-containing protein [Celeribacter naphthalenivorans]
MEWEIFTTGGGYYLQDVFNMLAAYTASGNFKNLLAIGSIIGIGWMSLQLSMGGSIANAGKYILTMLIVMMFTLGPKSRVVIIDKTMGTIPIYGIVDNVPTPVAMLGHYTSAVSYYLTGQMETLLSTPTDLTYQKNGMLFGASLLAQAANWRAVSPIIHENTVNFFQQCVIDATNLGHMDVELISTSGDLESVITANMPASLAYYDVVTKTTRICSEGWNDVKTAVNGQVDAVLTRKAASYFQGTTSTGAANINRLKGTLEDFQGMMAMSSASSVHTIKQAMLVNAMDDSLTRFIANSGNSAAMDIYQVSRADIQTRSSYAAIGANAAKWVPLLKIVFENLYYAAFPMAVMMMMTPLAPTVLKGYAGGFVWIAAWEPLSAILHSIVIKAAAGYYRTAGAVTSDGTVNDVVVSWSNHFGIRAVEQDVGTVAGFLMMSVPFLATAILFGANKMVGMATSMLNVSQGAAIETGREAATGSISLGNMSMNNYAANKANMSSMLDVNRHSAVAPNGSIVTQNGNGFMNYSAGTAVGSGAMSAQVSKAVRSEIATRAEESRTLAESAANELGTFISNGASQLTSFGQNVLSGKGTQNGTSWDVTDQSSLRASEAFRKIEDFGKQNGVSTETALQAVLAGSLGYGAGGPVGPQASASLQAQGALRGVSTEQFSQLSKAATEAGLSDDLSHIITARESQATSSSSSQQISAGEERRFSLDEGERLAQTFITRQDEAKTFGEALSRIESGSSNIDTNLNQMIANELRSRGENPLEVAQIINPQTPAQEQHSREIISEVVDDFVNGYVGSKPIDQTGSYVANFNPSDFVKQPAREAQFISPDGTSTNVDLDGERSKATATYETTKGLNHEESAAQFQGTIERRETLKAEASQTVNQAQNGLDRNPAEAMWGRVTNWLNIDSGEEAKLRAAHPEAWTSPGAAMDYYGSNPDKFQGVVGRPFVDGDDLPSSPVNNQASIYPAPMQPMAMSPRDRDIAIRTVLGEAAAESAEGQAAVALVIRNRVEDTRFPTTIEGVALQHKQFSAWNSDASGNHLVTKYNPGDPSYEKAAYIVDTVMGGLVQDFTQGATHYYSPAGMNDLVAKGYQNNAIPTWLRDETESRNAPPVRIGGHVFTGQIKS